MTGRCHLNPQECPGDVLLMVVCYLEIAMFQFLDMCIISLWDAVGETCMTLVAIVCPLVQIGTDNKATDPHFNVIGPLF